MVTSMPCFDARGRQQISSQEIRFGTTHVPYYKRQKKKYRMTFDWSHPIEAVFYDMDGTLLDSEPLTEAAVDAFDAKWY